MPKLHEMIAVVDGKKTHTRNKLTELHRYTQKAEFFVGHERTYHPKTENDEKLPPEKRVVQQRVTAAVQEANRLLSELWQAVSTQDEGNTKARADVVLESGTVIAKSVPVTHLLFLEKQMDDVQKFIDSLVVLDPSVDWKLDANTDLYRSDPVETVRTTKQMYPVVLHEGNDKHPPQVKEATRDVQIGTYHVVNFSGAIPAKTKREMLERVRSVKDAIKSARSRANEQAVEQQNFGADILKYVFE